MSMTGKIDRVEVITSVQRRRRWLAKEKARIVQETYAPGMSVSLVARQHGIAPSSTCKPTLQRCSHNSIVSLSTTMPFIRIRR